MDHSEDVPHDTRKASVLWPLILAPAVVVAMGVCALEGYRTVRPDSRLFTLAPAASLADALLHGTVEQAYAFIRLGADPNAALTVEDPVLAGGRRVSVSPMVLAVAAGNENAALMLLGSGARLDLPGNLLAICLAEELADPDVLEALPPVASPLECPEHVLGP